MGPSPGIGEICPKPKLGSIERAFASFCEVLHIQFLLKVKNEISNSSRQSSILLSWYMCERSPRPLIHTPRQEYGRVKVAQIFHPPLDH